MPKQTQPYRLADFRPSTDRLDRGMVLILRPVTPHEANLWETGPMFRVRYIATGRETEAFLDELDPTFGDERPFEWGAWWDAEDHESSGGSQFFIETGDRQSRRESFENSIVSERAILAAEAVVRRAAADEGVQA